MAHDRNGDRPLSKAEMRAAADRVSKERFGVPASRLSARLTSGSTGESAQARRLAMIARYAKK